MIINFKSKCAHDIYDGINSKLSRQIPRELHAKIRRLLDQINAAPTIDTLKMPPGNKLEKLKGNFQSFWSLRINNQWRIIFRWINTDALDVDIVDYH